MKKNYYYVIGTKGGLKFGIVKDAETFPLSDVLHNLHNNGIVDAVVLNYFEISSQELENIVSIKTNIV